MSVKTKITRGSLVTLFLYVLVFVFLLLVITEKKEPEKNVPENTPPPMITPFSRVGGVLNGKATSLPKPDYPEEARRAKVGGKVQVRLLINKAGDVVKASAISGDPILRPAAEEAALQAKFTPTLLSGEPVEVSGLITYTFTP